MKKIFKIHFLVIYVVLLLFMPFIFFQKNCVTLMTYPPQPGGCQFEFYINYGLNLLFKADIYNFDMRNSSSFGGLADIRIILTWLITNFLLAMIISGIWLSIKKATTKS